MGLFTGIVLLVLGLLSASSAIVLRKPNAQVLIDKLAPYQGWIGFITCLWGVWGLITAILNLSWLSAVPIWWLTLTITAFLEFALGLLLGYGLLSKYLLSKNETAAAKGEEVRLKLAKKQIPLGYLAIVFGIWTIVASFLFHV